ncbi:8-oxo-dGTP diphosphatase [Paenibacillus hemerocallicola]|uniref:8-oxo-dGTP diphosphatase n=1 Tax=Paenibacillus hemerocallicola TaxID=1172614 RepID=A0A5C4THH6_9BACL|nr:8-oxo-dGTP diphosphatase [Paenibacillus hemerocallicola]TNJ68116.1 8-oxo-dGTP diphosphatase [Paenibacillus hemerocallicola]
MLKYTLCLIRQGSKILLLNREHPAWMGCWNGIGGKIEKEEQPRSSMLREIQEETQIESPELSFKGLITWTTVEGAGFGGLYLYAAEIPDEYEYVTPIKTEEGILDWKEISWIMHPDNQGVASNVPSCLEKVLYESSCYNHHSIFSDKIMVTQISTKIDPRIEADEAMRTDYLNQYLQKYIEAGFAIK